MALNLSIPLELKRRQRPEPMCRYIVGQRQSIFKDLACNECVAIGLLVAWSDFDRLIKASPKDVNNLAQLCVNKLEGGKKQGGKKQGEKYDLWKDFLLFCRCLIAETRPTFLLEGISYFANCYLKNQSDREKLHSQLVAFTSQLSTVSLNANEDGRQDATDVIQDDEADVVQDDEADVIQDDEADVIQDDEPGRLKRKHEQIAPEVNNEGQTKRRKWERKKGDLFAAGAVVSEVQKFLGPSVFEGFQNCHQRREELHVRITRFVELYFPRDMGEDFTLAVTVRSDTGQAIEEALSGPFEKISDLLGEQVFLALTRSRAYSKAATSCVNVYQHKEGKDVVVEMILGFDDAFELFHRMFPKPVEDKVVPNGISN